MIGARATGRRFIIALAVTLASLSPSPQALAEEAQPSGEEEAAPESAPEGQEAAEQAEEETSGEPEEDPALTEARRLFQQGVALARSGNCDGAIAEFNASLELVRRPATIYNVAQCQERLHRYDLALEAYREYLESAPEDDPDRGTVETTIRLLTSLLGTLSLRSNVPAEVWIDDRLMGQAPGEVPVPAGRHVVQLRAEGYLPAQQELEIAGGQQLELSLVLGEARQEVTIHQHTTEQASRLAPTYFWISAAAALGSAAVAVGLGVWALSLRGDVQELDPRLRRQEDLDRIDRAALLTDVFWGIAGAFTIAAVILGVMTDWSTDDDIPAVGRGRVRLAPIVLEGGLGLTLGGAL